MYIIWLRNVKNSVIISSPALQYFAALNPLTYFVDAVRGLMISVM